MKFFWLCGSAFGFLAVALGAFAAHALKDRVSAADIEIFKTGATYQMVHALALVLVGFGLKIAPSPWPWLSRAGIAFIFGIVVFSGSLYLLVLTQQRWLGAITPLGGVAFLIGWCFLFVAALKS